MTTSARIQTLDIIGLGLTVEMFRQSAALQEMDKLGDKLIIKQDQKYYQWSGEGQGLVTAQRKSATLEQSLSYFTAGWVIPTVSVLRKSAYKEEKKKFWDEEYDQVDDLRPSAGLHGHQTKQVKAIFSDYPESLMESIFDYFDYYPELPAILLFVSDKGNRTEGDHKLSDPTESISAILLARRDRVDSIRPYVRPSTGPLAYEPVQPKGKPPFQPSKFVPMGWLDWQIKQFDDLPTIAILHRPVTVSYMKDKDGKPTLNEAAKKSIMSDHDKQIAFQAAWGTAMSALPADKKPAKIFYDHGDASHARALVPLSLTLHLQEPHFDLFDAKQGYNIHRRLGETGAASPFVMWNLAAISNYREQKPVVTVNLRNPNSATITVISPANDKRRHPAGDPIDFGLAPQYSHLPALPGHNSGEDNFDPDATIPPQLASHN